MTDTADTPDAATAGEPVETGGDGTSNELRITLPGNVNVGTGSTSTATTTRPGGDSLADQVATLAARLDDALADRDGKIKTRQTAKGAAAAADERVDELTREVAKLTEQQARNTIAEQAQAAGARDPFLVAKVVADADNPEAAIKAMTKSHPEMFGKGQTRRAGADMNGGAGSAGGAEGPQTELGKFVADRWGGGQA